MIIFINRNQPIQYINRIPYLIYAIIPISKVDTIVTDVKNYLGCSTAFKNDREGNYYFCEEIKEVEFEEITEE